MNDKANFTLIGHNGMQLDVFEERIEFKPTNQIGGLVSGKLGSILGTARAILSNQGSETIFISDITSIEVKETYQLVHGYIRFSIMGSRTHLFEFFTNAWGVSDDVLKNETAMAIKEFILQKMQNNKAKVNTTQISSPVSQADEIIKLAKLKEDGILTDEEFISAKRKILGL